MSLLPGARKFIPTEAPGDYVAGVGRGAVGFTTRAEYGKAEAKPEKPELFGKPPVGYVAGRGRGATGFSGGVSRDDSAQQDPSSLDKADYSETNFDEFTGYGEALFKDTEYDEEDREADMIYDAIEDRMDTRRKSRRENKLKEELAKIRAEKRTMQQQFADVRRALSAVTKEEWESIPNIGDYSLKHKQKKPQTFTPAPDSLLHSARNSNSIAGSATPIGFGIQTPIGFGGLATPLGLQTPLGLRTPLGLHTPISGSTTSLTPSLNDLGEARGTVLSVKLDKVMDNLSGQTVIDPKGYLTDLNSMQLKTEADIADIKKARTLLKSVITTNPKHPPGWIAAARLEELAGKIQAARELIAQGCKECSKSEDIWLEAARLEKHSNAKAVLAKAVKQLPHSVRLWMDAANREQDKDSKSRVLRKALEFIPNSVRLWKEVISLEDDEKNARILLARAVECVPQSVEMWLALARLSTYQTAQKVLNEARKKIPTSADIWVSACKLEETHGNDKMVETIISRAIENLSSKGVMHQRENWLKLAEEAEKSGYIKTCRAIIKATMKIGVEEVNMKRTWKEDAESCLSRGGVETARAIYTNSLTYLKTKKGLWLALADLEMKHGTPQSLDAVLQRAVTFCPNAEVLWLMAAKQKWLQNDVPAARRILAEAFSHCSVNTESISLAAVKLERENHEYARARKLLQRARHQCNSFKVWMQSVQLERQLGNYEAAIKLNEEALNRYPNIPKFWMIGGHLHMEKPQANLDDAFQVFSRGLEVCPQSVQLWMCAVDCQRQQKEFNKARALLEKARLHNSSSELLWLSTVHVEQEAQNPKMAYHFMSKALQHCPHSGILWSEAIFLEPKSAQNAKSVDALNKCENDAHVMMAVSKLFWRDNKVIKARKWLNRAVTLNPNLGDAWGAYLAFEIQNGDTNSIMDVIDRCTRAEPNSGLTWNKITKRVENWTLKYPEKLRKYVEEVHHECLINWLNLDQSIRDILEGKNLEKYENKIEEKVESKTIEKVDDDLQLNHIVKIEVKKEENNKLSLIENHVEKTTEVPVIKGANNDEHKETSANPNEVEHKDVSEQSKKRRRFDN